MNKLYNIGENLKINHIYTAFRKKRAANYQFKGERHNCYELVILLSGKIGVTSESDIFILNEGEAIIHEPMEFHRLWCEGNESEIIVITFDAENMITCESKIFKIHDIKTAENIINKIRSSFYTSGDFITGFDNTSHTYQTVIKTLELFLLTITNSISTPANPLQNRATRNYLTIVNYLENNLDKPLSLSQIASACNTSEATLTKTFARYAGIGPIHYLNSLKINTAIPLIKSGISIKEVSDILGFNNQNYFSKVFKKQTGYPPSYFKRGK